MVLVGDTVDVCFVKMEPQRREAREDAAVDGDMELARTTPVVFFIKQAPWRMEARSSEDAAAFRGHGAMEFAKMTPMSQHQPGAARIVTGSSQEGRPPSTSSCWS